MFVTLMDQQQLSEVDVAVDAVESIVVLVYDKQVLGSMLLI